MGRTRRIELCRQNKMDAASRQLLFMSFKGIGKSIRMVRAPTQNADAPAHHSDQFPAGYSLTRCSPAALVSASPAGLDYAAALAQLRGLRGKITKEDCFKNENRLETAKQSTQGWVNDHENPWVNDCENPHAAARFRKFNAQMAKLAFIPRFFRVTTKCSIRFGIFTSRFGILTSKRHL